MAWVGATVLLHRMRSGEAVGESPSFIGMLGAHHAFRAASETRTNESLTGDDLMPRRSSAACTARA